MTNIHNDYRDIAHILEKKWQDHWHVNKTYDTPNPGETGFDKNREKFVVLDFFPYPSGIGLHVGHPLGYIATDVKARFMRMRGYNVLHSMGFDSFGLPAEQFAIQTGQHPRITTNANIDNMLAQLNMLGLGHDPRRRFSTSDSTYYRWTQWIFLQLYNSFYDPTVRWRGPNGHEVVGRARPISELPDLLRDGTWTIDRTGRPVPANIGSTIATPGLSPVSIADAVEKVRLAFLDEVPVNWCPELGTVLSNEEVTREGRSERGDYPVFKKPLRQWMLRITEYADRLLQDLSTVDWPFGIKEMQVNWIGRSDGVEIRFQIAHSGESLNVFTTRPETLGGATFIAIAHAHPLANKIIAESQIEIYREFARRHTNDVRDSNRACHGFFTGSYAISPLTGSRVPIWIADYVMATFATGAVMGVPAHDARDFKFATTYEIPMIAVVMPPPEWLMSQTPDKYAHAPDSFGRAFEGKGRMIANYANDLILDGVESTEAASKITAWLEQRQLGSRRTQYKLKDWLFSRQRYWGEPFPIVFDEAGKHYPLSYDNLPVELPDLADFTPASGLDSGSSPTPPLAKATEWTHLRGVIRKDGFVVPVSGRHAGHEIELEGQKYAVHNFTRELNTMPNWAGSCWYYLRYFDPMNSDHFVAPSIERYWSLSPTSVNRAGSIDLYVGGAEHAVLHLLYARFWHKVLYDLGYVSTHEPFNQLFNQGMITADAFRDSRGVYRDSAEVVVRDTNQTRCAFDRNTGESLEIISGKMGKRYKNGVAPEDVCAEFSVDTFRLYELYMGPLDASKPWQTEAVVGMMRFLSSVWRNTLRARETASDHRLESIPLSPLANKTIQRVTEDIINLRLNTAIAALIEFNNGLTRQVSLSTREVITLGLLLAPFAPHLSEEIVSLLAPELHAQAGSSSKIQWPEPESTTAEETLKEFAVSIDGKFRTVFTAPGVSTDDYLKNAALRLEPIKRALNGVPTRRVLIVRSAKSNIINFVTHSA